MVAVLQEIHRREQRVLEMSRCLDAHLGDLVRRFVHQILVRGFRVEHQHDVRIIPGIALVLVGRNGKIEGVARVLPTREEFLPSLEHVLLRFAIRPLDELAHHGYREVLPSIRGPRDEKVREVQGLAEELFVQHRHERNVDVAVNHLRGDSNLLHQSVPKTPSEKRRIADVALLLLRCEKWQLREHSTPRR